MDEIDSVVIGAGVIGLAIARALAQSGRETLILEKETLIGSGISSRNSEVIHAGIYYPRDSLKARFCVAGRRNLYAYCAAHKIAHLQCGKLIVATSAEQIPELEAIRRGAEANGIDDLTWLNTAEIGRLEPALKSAGALLSPSTGIIDSHGLMLALRGDAEEAGAMIAFGTEITRAAIESRGIAIWTNTGTGGPDIRARLVVNAAGLFARDVARLIEGFPAAHIPPGWFAKGSYFRLSGRSPFSRLVYPVPEPGGLGVHLTLDLGGQARFGPDVEWQDDTEPSELDYAVDPARATHFYGAIRTYWPGLRDGDLVPAYSGIRPKLSGPGQAAADFLITDFARHGVPGLINLFGMESPGLTSSLAIATAVLGLAEVATDAWGK
jgi:L-2-hydroxyglutarate oxidase LhgO